MDAHYSDLMPGCEVLSTSAEPYPIPQHVFDALVEKWVGGADLTAREKVLFDYVTDVNEVALAERKLSLVDVADMMGLSDEQLEALGMALTIDGSIGADAEEDPYAWKDHDGGACPVSEDTQVFVRYHAAGERGPGFAGYWFWDYSNYRVASGPETYDIVAYRLARPDEVK